MILLLNIKVQWSEDHYQQDLKSDFILYQKLETLFSNY